MTWAITMVLEATVPTTTIEAVAMVVTMTLVVDLVVEAKEEAEGVWQQFRFECQWGC